MGIQSRKASASDTPHLIVKYDTSPLDLHTLGALASGFDEMANQVALRAISERLKDRIGYEALLSDLRKQGLVYRRHDLFLVRSVVKTVDISSITLWLVMELTQAFNALGAMATNPTFIRETIASVIDDIVAAILLAVAAKMWKAIPSGRPRRTLFGHYADGRARQMLEDIQPFERGAELRIVHRRITRRDGTVVEEDETLIKVPPRHGRPRRR